MFPRRTALATLAALAAACSSDGRIPASSRPVPDAGPEDAGGGVTCEGPGYAEAADPLPFAGLTASLVDEAGQPVAQVTAQACGINLCLNGKSDDAGRVRITDQGSLSKVAFKYGGGQRYARFALPLDVSSGAVLALGEQRTVAFDPPEDGAELRPGGSATSRGATLTLPEGAVLTTDPFDFGTDELRRFRAAEIPEAAWPEAVPASLGFALVVAMTPSDGELCPRAKLTLDNEKGLPAGAAVEFFVHGTDILEPWAPYGGWAKVSDGAVSDDGRTIETSPDGGLPVLSVVGVRLAR